MSTDLQTVTVDGDTVARVLLHGDLKQLTPEQKVHYYHAVCESVGLNPLTQPFQYLVLNGKEILYARREATEQLRRIHNVSISIVAREVVDGGLYAVTARATLPSGRTDENIGAVSLEGLKGEARANALMKAETKSKRRVTLAICGLGMLDESEVADIPPGPMRSYDTRVAPPPALAPDPGEELPDGVVRIERIDSAPTKNPNVTKYRITDSNGETSTTIKQFLAALAQRYCEEQTPVRAETKATQWGLELLKLTPADAPAPSPEPPPTAEDIPF